MTDAKGNVVDPKGSLTITGGGTVSTKAAASSPGDLTVSGGTTLSSGGGIGVGSYRTNFKDVTVSGGSVVQSSYDYHTSDTNISLSANNVTVTDSSVDLSSGYVMVDGTLTVTRSDFRCSDVLVVNALSLQGSEVKSGSRQSDSTDQSLFSDYQSYEYDHQDVTPDKMPAGLSPTKTAAEKAAPSTATADKGVLAVRKTPVAAANAPEETSSDAVYQTFIVSSVCEEATSGTFSLGFSVGSGYAGRAAKVYVQHEDGTEAVLDATVGEDGLVLVTTKKLSRYTVVVKGEKAPATTATTAATTESAANTPAPAAAASKAAPAKPAAAHLSASGESIPQTGDPFGAAPAVLAALGALAFFEAKHLRREE